MGYTYHMSDGSYEAGDYARFTIFENALATRPFGLVQRNFKLKQFFNAHPNTGGRNDEGRVMDCLCRLDAVLMGKTGHEYPLLTPILPVKQLYDIKMDQPALFMKRIERWAIENKKAVKIGKLKWETDYEDQKKADQKYYECIDVLLNTAQLDLADLVFASKIILADDTSPVKVINPEFIEGHVYDLRSGQDTSIKVLYTQTNETALVSVGRLTSYFKAGRVTNVNIIQKGALVSVKKPN